MHATIFLFSFIEDLLETIYLFSFQVYIILYLVLFPKILQMKHHLNIKISVDNLVIKTQVINIVAISPRFLTTGWR